MGLNRTGQPSSLRSTLIDCARLALAAVVVVPLGLVMLQSVAPGVHLFGFSLSQNEPVTYALLERLPSTLELALVALISALVGGLAIAALAARTSKAIASHLLLALHCIPYFWLVLAAQIVLATHGAEVTRLEQQFFFAASTLTLFLLPPVAQYFIGCLGLENQTPQARTIAVGMIERLADRLPELIAATMLTEILWAWPGVGRALFNAFNEEDVPLIAGVLLSSALLVLAVRFVARAIAHSAGTGVGTIDV